MAGAAGIVWRMLLQQGTPQAKLWWQHAKTPTSLPVHEPSMSHGIPASIH
jgi:hypothetical protein